jgi:hypothetical protein
MKKLVEDLYKREDVEHTFYDIMGYLNRHEGDPGKSQIFLMGYLYGIGFTDKQLAIAATYIREHGN